MRSRRSHPIVGAIILSALGCVLALLGIISYADQSEEANRTGRQYWWPNGFLGLLASLAAGCCFVFAIIVLRSWATRRKRVREIFVCEEM